MCARGGEATHRAQIEVVGERGAHLGIRHVALDLVRVRLGLGCGLGLGLGAHVGICYGAVGLWHVLVQPLQQQLLPRLLRVRVRVSAGVRTRAKVGVRVKVGLMVQAWGRVKVCGQRWGLALLLARLLDPGVLGAAVLDLTARPTVEPVGAHLI